MIADARHDSAPLRERLRKRVIEMIVLCRKDNQRRCYEGRRKTAPSRVRRRILERNNVWPDQFRRLLVRHEHLLSVYRAFFYLDCFWVTLRHYL